MSAEDDAGFEAALRQLEQVADELEAGELGLDEALARYERGVRLLGRLRARLDGAERRVALLTAVDASGGPVTSPFDVGREPAPNPAPATAAIPAAPDDGGRPS